ncbi:MAG: hypothetical protein RBT38_11035 [Bacteroidales bacterium]|jgi:hypothetical protein|nr:hypothetical protein [Bacteroidales bacterium]
MYKAFFFISILIFPVSCKKDNTTYFFPKYEDIQGTWNLQSVSWDSSGVRITRTIPFDRMVVHDNLDYQIYMDHTKPVEDGTINIITQTSDKLVLYFYAEYPSYSSFAGSHIFGSSNVELVSLSAREMVFITINAGYGEYSDWVITFKR